MLRSFTISGIIPILDKILYNYGNSMYKIQTKVSLQSHYYVHKTENTLIQKFTATKILFIRRQVTENWINLKELARQFVKCQIHWFG